MAWLRELAWPFPSAVLDGEAVAGDGGGHASHELAQADHPFSSFLSSLRKRQSVLCAMNFCGLDLIIPAS